MEMCSNMKRGEFLAFKLAIITFTIIVLKIWTGALNWVLSVNVWWFVAIFVLSLWKMNCCKGYSATKTKVVKKTTRGKKK